MRTPRAAPGFRPPPTQSLRLLTGRLRAPSLLACAALMALAAAPALAAPPQPDALARARVFYNQQQYDQAITSAETALRLPALANSARLVIGRAYLERFRRTADAADLAAGRAALREVQAAQLPARDQAQLIVGLGEALYLDNAFGPAADIFSSALASSTPADLRDTVLDWWATSLDRVALAGPPDDRHEVYMQIAERMEDELARDPASTAAAYWLAAASRGAGDVERAWDAAIAGWVRALLAPQRGAQLRADLDHLVETAIIPERARAIGPNRDRAIADLQKEWEAIKADWK